MIVCSGTFGPAVPFIEKAAAAARAGFDGISIYTREYEPGLASRLDDLGLTVAEVDGTMAWRPGQDGTEVERYIEIAAELRARCVTVLDTTGEALDPAAASDDFARVCERAAAAGLAADIEPFAWSGIATIAEAAEIVRRAGQTNGGITLDVWHLVRGPEGGRLEAAHLDLVHALQVSDPAPDAERRPASLRDECMSDRRPPGEWSVRIAQALPGVPLELEVLNATGTPDEVAGTAYRALARLHGAVTELLRARGS